jgi:sRNA-binding protein
MDVSEDGTVTGSIDVNALGEVEAKTDEAKAQLEQLKAQAKAGNEEADKAAEDSLKAAEAQTRPVPEGKGTTSQSTPVGDPNPPVQPKKTSESESKSTDKKG